MTELTYTRLRSLADPDHLPALNAEYIRTQPALGLGPLDPAPRILLLYGSLRERSYSRLVAEETARLLQLFGCETRIFDPSDLPLPDQIADDDHPAVEELRQHSIWSEGQVWCSPERHGQITGIMKAQVDHLPLAYKGLRPTQGRALAVMQVSAGSQSFNSVNTLRILGRWMRMITIHFGDEIGIARQNGRDAPFNLQNVRRDFLERDGGGGHIGRVNGLNCRCILHRYLTHMHGCTTSESGFSQTGPPRLGNHCLISLPHFNRHLTQCLDSVLWYGSYSATHPALPVSD